MYRLGEKYLSVEKETAKRMFGIIFGWKMFRGKDRGSKRERESLKFFLRTKIKGIIMRNYKKL